MQQETGRKESGSEERGDRLGAKEGGLVSGEKGDEEGVTRMGESSRAPPSPTLLWIPLEALQAFGRLDFGGLEEEKEHFWARGQGGDGWKPPTFGPPASLHVPACLLGKIPLLDREI